MKKTEMEKKKQVELQDVCTNIVDCPHSTAPDEGEGIALVRTPNIGKGVFNLEGVHRISKEVFEKRCSRIRPRENDLIFAREAPAGNVALITSSTEQLCLGQRTVLLRPNLEYVSPRFLVYFLLHPVQQYNLLKKSAGSTVAHINIPDIKRLKLQLPPLPTQQKIASILSAYDELIQNYKKQIDALQTAASELYKEWFVRFRFPGYQTAEFENGIPKGWKIVLASELGEFIRGKNITAEEMQEGMIPVISAGIEPSGFHNQSNVKGVSLTISNSGANAGYLQINYSDIWAADCSYCNSAKHIYFYYELLNNMRVVLFNLQKGAAQPHVYAKDINKMKILLPPSELVETANNKIKLMHEKIYSLQQQITNLTQQRDLLLPRLMSGKLEVE